MKNKIFRCGVTLEPLTSRELWPSSRQWPLVYLEFRTSLSETRTHHPHQALRRSIFQGLGISSRGWGP